MFPDSSAPGSPNPLAWRTAWAQFPEERVKVTAGRIMTGSLVRLETPKKKTENKKWHTYSIGSSVQFCHQDQLGLGQVMHNWNYSCKTIYSKCALDSYCTSIERLEIKETDTDFVKSVGQKKDRGPWSLGHCGHRIPWYGNSFDLFTITAQIP